LWHKVTDLENVLNKKYPVGHLPHVWFAETLDADCTLWAV